MHLITSLALVCCVYSFVQITRAGLSLEAQHYHALVSAALASGAFAEAISTFNGLRRRGMPTPAWLWAAMFRALHAGEYSRVS